MKFSFIGKASPAARSIRYLANALKTSGHRQRSHSTVRAVGDSAIPLGHRSTRRHQLAHRYGGAFHAREGRRHIP